MNETNSKSFKIRFKLITGEEFEAEGTQEFIDSQRTMFLELSQRQPHANTPRFSTDLQQPGSMPEPFPKTYLPGISQPDTAIFTGKRLWEQVVQLTAENLPILRKKAHTSPQEGALLLLAALQELRGDKGGLNAISLSRALQQSGFADIGRLDRLLAPLIELGYLTSQGSKRSRKYMLTQPGLTRAFVLASKKAGESL